MIPFETAEIQAKFSWVSKEEVMTAEFESIVGHQDTANILSNELGKEVKFNRISVELKAGDILYVATFNKKIRLPEGATTLPEGVEFVYQKVEIL